MKKDENKYLSMGIPLGLLFGAIIGTIISIFSSIFAIPIGGGWAYLAVSSLVLLWIVKIINKSIYKFQFNNIDKARKFPCL